MADEREPSEAPEPETPAQPEALADAASSDAASSDTASSEEAPKKKRKKSKKKDDDGAEAELAARDPRVLEIGRAFDAGDFARVRELAGALAKESDPALVDVSRDYLARIGVDGIQIAFLGLCAVVILSIAMHYIGH